jgi:hypothetical protein
VVEVRVVAPGLWLWRQSHPAWREGFARACDGPKTELHPILPGDLEAALEREPWSG